MKKLLKLVVITMIMVTLIMTCGCSSKKDATSTQEPSSPFPETDQKAMATDENEKLFEEYVNKADEYYDAGEYQLAITALETALTHRESRPVRELLEHYRSEEHKKPVPSYTPEEKQQAIKEMQTYQEGDGVLKIALDNIYTREFAISNVPIQISDDTIFLKLWVNVINEGTKDVLVKPEYVKLYTSDERCHTYHPEYSKHLDIPFNEMLLPPNGRESGRLLFLLPLENSYRFEYDDGENKVTKTVIPY